MGRWFRRITVVGIALVLLVLLARAGVDVWASRGVSAQTAKLEAQHGSLDLDTLRVAPVPPEDNRARAMRAAAALLVEDDGVQASLRSFMAQPGVAVMPADLRAFVEGNRAALRVAHDARARRDANWEVDYATSQNVPGLMEIRRLSNALYLEARLALEAGNPGDGARALATGLALSASLRQEPSLVAQLIRCAVALQQFEGVQRLLMEAEPSEAALAMLAEVLSGNRAPAPMHMGLLGELKTFHAAIGRSVSGEGGLWPGQVAWLSRPLFRVAHARYLEGLGRVLDAELGPRPRSGVLVTDPPEWSLIPGGVLISIRGLERSMDTGDLHTAALGMTELAVALRRFRLAHGGYPETLAALAPTYIATVPSDPLSGTVPVYARQGAGFTLHSESGKDDTRPHAAAISWSVTR